MVVELHQCICTRLPWFPKMSLIDDDQLVIRKTAPPPPPHVSKTQTHKGMSKCIKIYIKRVMHSWFPVVSFLCVITLKKAKFMHIKGTRFSDNMKIQSKNGGGGLCEPNTGQHVWIRENINVRGPVVGPITHCKQLW